MAVVRFGDAIGALSLPSRDASEAAGISDLETAEVLSSLLSGQRKLGATSGRIEAIIEENKRSSDDAVTDFLRCWFEVYDSSFCNSLYSRS